jgi:hypothetical protein
LTARDAAVPVPLKAIVAVLLVEELLVMVSCPVAVPAVVGSNCTSSVAVWPEDRVMGKVTPETAKPVPVSAAALTVTDAVPVDVKVTACVEVAFTVTSPKARLVALTLSVDVPTLTVNITVCVAVV